MSQFAVPLIPRPLTQPEETQNSEKDNNEAHPPDNIVHSVSL